MLKVFHCPRKTLSSTQFDRPQSKLNVSACEGSINTLISSWVAPNCRLSFICRRAQNEELNSPRSILQKSLSGLPSADAKDIRGANCILTDAKPPHSGSLHDRKTNTFPISFQFVHKRLNRNLNFLLYRSPVSRVQIYALWTSAHCWPSNLRPFLPVERRRISNRQASATQVTKLAGLNCEKISLRPTLLGPELVYSGVNKQPP